jgi:hypothetical protein
MIVKPAPTFQHPHLFLIGGRPLTETSVEPVGVLIIKQAFNLDGTPLPMPADPPDDSPLQILMSDVFFKDPQDGVGGEKLPRNPGESDTDYLKRALLTKYESDLASIKPNVDLLFVRNWNARNVLFGYVWINPNGSPGRRFRLLRGLRERGDALRIAKSGNSGAFQPVDIPDPFNPPPLERRLDLPNGFDELFFQSTSIISEDDPPPNLPYTPIEVATGPALQSGDVVAYAFSVSNPQTFLATITIPAAPILRFTLNGKQITPVFRSSGVDTVLLDWNLNDESLSRFLITWRFVFVWEARFELATLEVS